MRYMVLYMWGLCMCMHVYLSMSKYICTSIYVYILIWHILYICVYQVYLMHACMCVWISYIRTYTYTYIRVWCLCIRMFVSCRCIFIHIHACIYVCKCILFVVFLNVALFHCLVFFQVVITLWVNGWRPMQSLYTRERVAKDGFRARGHVDYLQIAPILSMKSIVGNPRNAIYHFLIAEDSLEGESLLEETGRHH